MVERKLDRQRKTASKVSPILGQLDQAENLHEQTPETQVTGESMRAKGVLYSPSSMNKHILEDIEDTAEEEAMSGHCRECGIESNLSVEGLCPNCEKKEEGY